MSRILLLILTLSSFNTLMATNDENIHTIIIYDHTEFILEAPGKATYTSKVKFTRLNSSSPQDILPLRYNERRKIKDAKVWIYDKNGDEIASYKKKDFLDQKRDDSFSIFVDGRIKYLDLSFPNFPYTIAYEYTYELDEIYGINDWYIQHFNTKTLETSYTCKVPKNYILHFKPYNTEIQPRISTEGEYDVYAWSQVNPDIIEKEPHTPDVKNILPMVALAPSKFEIEGHAGSMSTWHDFGAFIYNLNDNRDDVSEGLQNEVKKMTGNCTSTKEKIKVLYKYMQDQCRYVSVQIGIGGWQTFPASYVEENKYGDCKALSNYMKALLKVAGIESFMVIISAGDDPEFVDENFVQPSFNHAILYVPEEDMFIECTSKNNPAGYLGDFTDDRLALICGKDGGYLKRTPTYNYTYNTSFNTTDIFFDHNGNATVNEKQVIQGMEHDFYRMALNYITETELKDRIVEEYSTPPRSMDKFEMVVAQDNPTVSINESFTFNRLASKAGNRLFIPLAPLKNDYEAPEASDNRKHPYQIPYGFTHIDTVIYHFPEKYEIENLSLENTTIDEPFGSFSIQILKGENELTIVRKLVRKKVTILARSYNRYLEFYKSIKKLDNNKLILVNPGP